jgi:hypothetical protein
MAQTNVLLSFQGIQNFERGVHLQLVDSGFLLADGVVSRFAHCGSPPECRIRRT